MVAIRKTIAHEGNKGFLKGMVAPLVGSAPYNSGTFIITEKIKREINNANLSGWFGTE